MATPSDLAQPAIAGGEPLFDQLLVFGQPALGEEEVEAVSEVIRSRWIGQGPKCAEFEERFAELVGARHAVSVSSCTAGMHLALAALGIGPGDEVITTSLTFVATLNAVLHTGAEVVLADVDPETYALDPRLAAEKVTERTKAIMPVHFAGHPVDLDAFRALGEEHGLAIVEDAAHALPALYGGEPIGRRGIACFSFYANKNVTTAEGGMVTCEDDELAERLEVLRLHGLSRDAWKRFRSKKVVYSDAIELGFKYNLTDLQAALGLVQLRRLDEFMDVRRRICAVYDEELAGVPGLRLPVRPWTDELRHAHHLYIVEVDPEEFGCDRDELLAGLRAENIGAGIHYRAAHLHPYYRRTLDLPDGALPVAERLSAQVLSLPLSAAMTEEDAARVALAVRRLHAHHRR
ncbi:MAG TPA: DegT/DnrJ/EryC1/StrS family aminotransferase [Gaiellaceae bacterium]|nr:DegT/DnrJ/EryC1/StrS family aminotransferase [Gaiellaceae bacterium]